jgi:hypothetical protein
MQPSPRSAVRRLPDLATAPGEDEHVARGRTWRRPMRTSLSGRRRVLVLAIAAVAVGALLLVGVTARYFLVRADRQRTEQSVEDLTRVTRDALALLRSVSATRGSADTYNAETTAERDGVRAIATVLHAELDKARAEMTSSALGAYVSGAEANFVGECLTGVSQALNQLSVGDGGAIRSLQAVEAQCRRAGMAT